MNPGDGDPRHGTENGYNNLHCRCPECREAWRVACYARGFGRRRVRRYASGLCATPGCARPQDKAYVTGLCHRCNIEVGRKPGGGARRILRSDP